MEKTDLDKFLDAEQAKIDRADELKKQLSTSFWRIFSPKYWKTLAEYRRVVESFEVGKFLAHQKNCRLCNIFNYK